MRHHAAGFPWILISALLVGACGETSPPVEPRQPAAEEQNAVVVAFLGDSLAAGLGVAEEDAFPAVAGRLLAERGLDVRIVNAGVSGDTTAGGLARLDWVLRSKPDVLVVELGGNDGLRGLPLDATVANLRAIVERGREAGARVLLVGMQVPTSYGEDWAPRFRDLYPRLAAELGIASVPDFLDGVGGVTALNQDDALHPNPAGHRRLAANLLPVLEAAVRDAFAARAASP